MTKGNEMDDPAGKKQYLASQKLEPAANIYLQRARWRSILHRPDSAGSTLQAELVFSSAINADNSTDESGRAEEVMHSKVDQPKERAKNSSKKIFRVPEDYGKGTPAKPIFGDIALERKHLDIFESHGYTIIRGGEFDADNPNELGVGVNGNIPQREVDQRIAERVGVHMPELRLPQDILKNDGVVVAKMPYTQRGEGKFLLETMEQKKKFLTFVLIMHNIAELYRPGVDTEAKVHKLMAKVEEGDYDDELFNAEYLNKWIFEEFIETPSIYPNSIRVIADAFGKIHYAQVSRSDIPRAHARYSSTEPLPTNEIAIWGVNPSIFVEHPDSPFYIAPKKITSNISAGGIPILLNGIPQQDNINREVLEALGIDPDRPELPETLRDPSSKIGIFSRGDYPFVGIDYLKRADNGSFDLLEINPGPQLRPEALGLHGSTDEAVSDAILMDWITALRTE